MLMEEGQGHVIAFWSELGKNDERKQSLVKQLCTIDATYPGGLQAYVRRGRELLAASCRGENPFDGYVPEVPTGVLLCLHRLYCVFRNLQTLNWGET
jgi:UDP-sugar pyrophosphorylase